MHSHPPSQWSLVGNIKDVRPSGVGGTEVKHGTKHFSGGTKVYCLPAQWGDGYEKIVVVGKHRGCPDLVRMVIRADWVTNWRAQVVYNPRVLALFAELGALEGRANWQSKEQVLMYLEGIKRPPRTIENKA